MCLIVVVSCDVKIVRCVMKRVRWQRYLSHFCQLRKPDDPRQTLWALRMSQVKGNAWLHALSHHGIPSTIKCMRFSAVDTGSGVTGRGRGDDDGGSILVGLCIDKLLGLVWMSRLP